MNDPVLAWVKRFITDLDEKQRRHDSPTSDARVAMMRAHHVWALRRARHLLGLHYSN